nr:MAG TPA: protein of unknown function DUF761 [Caudoviricetes sp.]
MVRFRQRNGSKLPNVVAKLHHFCFGDSRHRFSDENHKNDG